MRVLFLSLMITVSAIAEHAIEFVVKGAEPIVVVRTAETWFAHAVAKMPRGGGHIEITNIDGTVRKFVKEKSPLKLVPESGFKDAYIDVESFFEGLHVHHKDGTVRYYRTVGVDSERNTIFLLIHVRHSNGHWTRFEYAEPHHIPQRVQMMLKSDPYTHGLKRVWTCSADNNRIYSWLTIDDGMVKTSDKKTHHLDPDAPFTPQEIPPVKDPYTYKYDDFGNPIEQSLTGCICTEESEDTVTITRRYSKDGMRLEEEVLPSGLTHRYKYLKKTNLPLARYTCDGEKILMRHFWVYDEDNFLVEQIDDDGSALDRDDLTDVCVRRKNHIPAKTPPSSRPFIKTFDDGSQEKYRYDINGNCVEKIDRFGNTIEFAYDKLGRLVKKTVAGVVTDQFLYNRSLCTTHLDAEEFITEFIYDDDGNLLEKRREGRVVKEEKLEPITKANSTEVIDGISYTYDAFGKLTALKSADGTIDYSYTYDRLGRLKVAIDNITNATTLRTWTPHGELEEETLANGLTISAAYDNRGKLIGLVYPDHAHLHITDTKIAYHDPQGRLVLEQELAQAAEQVAPVDDPESTSSYDALGRVIRIVKGQEVSVYAYDPLHRRISTNNTFHYYYDETELGTTAGERHLLGPDGEIVASIQTRE